MDMFQAPTLLEDPFNNTSVLHAAEKDVDPGYPGNGKYAVNGICKILPVFWAVQCVEADTVTKVNHSQINTINQNRNWFKL